MEGQPGGGNGSKDKGEGTSGTRVDEQARKAVDSDTYIKIRLSHLDYIDVLPPDTSSMALRTSPFLPAGVQLYRVPEVRIFGATERGQRILLHVHGAMPYFYIQYDGNPNPDAVNAYIRKFGALLNHATAVSLGRPNVNAFDSKKSQFVGYIAFCKGIPFYGFHVGYRYFLKIYCLQPRFRKRMVALLRNGSIMSAKGKFGPLDEGRNAKGGFKIFEEHVPFHLQFMLDHNLYGCGWVSLSKCKFRRPLPDNAPSAIHFSNGSSTYEESDKLAYTRETVGREMLAPSSLEKSSHCTLEADCHVSDILNRRTIVERRLHQDFTEHLQNPIPEDQKLVNSVRELWEDERRRRRDRGEPGPEDVRGTAGSTQRDFAIGEQPEWATEAGLREQIERLVERYRRNRVEKHGPAAMNKLNFHDYVKPEASLQAKYVPTTFEAVEAIHPATWQRDEVEERPYGVWAINGIGVNIPDRQADFAGDLDVSHIGEMGDFRDDEDELEPPEEAPGADEADGDVLVEDALGDFGAVAPPQERKGTAEGGYEPSSPEVPPLPLFRSASDSEVGEGAEPSSNSTADPSLTDEQVIPNSSEAKMESFPARIAERVPRSAAPQPSRQNLFGSPTKVEKPPPAEPGPAPRFEGRKRPIEAQIAAFAEPRGGKLPRMFGVDPVPQALKHPVPPTRTVNGDPSAESLRGRESDQMGSDAKPDSPDEVMQPTFVQRTPDDALHPIIPTAIASTPIQPPFILTAIPSSPTQVPLIATAVPSSHQHVVSTVPSAGKAVQRTSQTPSNDELQVGQGFSSSGEALPSSDEPPADLPSDSHGFFRLARRPPPAAPLLSTVEPRRIYRDPYFSDPRDVPQGPSREYGGRRFPLHGSGLLYTRDFEHAVSAQFGSVSRASKDALRVRRWEYIHRPPSNRVLKNRPLSEASAAAAATTDRMDTNFLLMSQLEGPTQLNGGFKFTQLKADSTTRIKQHMDVLAIEVFGESRNGLLPDPEHDEIIAIFYCLQKENEDLRDNGRREGTHVGIILVCQDSDHPLAHVGENARLNWGTGLEGITIDVVDSELELLNVLVDKVRLWDPEILTGFEVEQWSWGYITQRVDAHEKRWQGGNQGEPGPLAGFDIVSELGRVKHDTTGRATGKNDRWGYTHATTLKVTGRHIIAIWRLLRSDVALTSYSFENIVFHVLRCRVPHYSAGTLAAWWASPKPEHKTRVLRYFLDRVEMDCHILDDAEMISRNAEFARVFGVDFFSVIVRGSQFKVESVMFRIAKPENFLLPSPSREEVGKQNAAECVPLIMEPQSAFFKAPLLVLDFQSLYPSVMIAYNLCYSTCLGRVGSFKGTFKFGITSLNLPDGLLSLLKDHVFVTPNGFMFVKPHIRKSLLSKMLSEILDTRVMVKKSMKPVASDRALSKMLNARQLGLKFIANVTYGYTSATFSGRMPAVEIADAIVQSGRETLEKAMQMIRGHSEWGAKVVYGDTDSLFVYLPNKTKDDAFRIGNEIADAVTKANPAPVKLKFEKVYLPCFLVAKKRYVGNKYENQADKVAEFDCKGLETIRRDGVPALQKLQESCIKEMFRSSDLSAVKSYLLRQFQRVQAGKVSMQDFIFAKEVKPGSYSDRVRPPPGPTVAEVQSRRDPRNEAAWGERIPYIVYKREKGALLSDSVVSPKDMLDSRELRIHDEYYITRSFLPALARLFNLVGADVHDWYARMPKTVRTTKASKQLASSSSQDVNQEEEVRTAPKFAIDQHFRTDACAVCGNRLSIPNNNGINDADRTGKKRTICSDCEADRAKSVHTLMSRAHHAEARRRDLHRICAACCDTPPSEAADIACDSLDCPVLYARVKARWECEDGEADARRAGKLEDEFIGDEKRLEKPLLVW